MAEGCDGRDEGPSTSPTDWADPRTVELEEENYLLRKKVAEARFRIRQLQNATDHATVAPQARPAGHAAAVAELRHKQELLAALQSRLRSRMHQLQNMSSQPPHHSSSVGVGGSWPSPSSSDASPRPTRENNFVALEVALVQLHAKRQERALLEEQLARERLSNALLEELCELHFCHAERRLRHATAVREGLEGLLGRLCRTVQLASTVPLSTEDDGSGSGKILHLSPTQTTTDHADSTGAS